MSRENGDFRVFPYNIFFHPPAPVIPAVISLLEDPTVLNEWVLVLDGKRRILKVEE